MGKSINNAALVKRTGMVAFFGVGAMAAHTFARMEGFTELTTSRNATEYNRQYVDEDNKRTDITGYDTSKKYSFDRYNGNAVLDDIVNITENELTGSEAVREIIVVDMSTVTEGSGKFYADAYRRQYSVIPDSDGDSTDCMTYSGTFKARGGLTKIKVTSATADWQSCYAGMDTDTPKLSNLTATGANFTDPSSFNPDVFFYQMTATTAKVSFNATAGSGVTISYMFNGVTVDSLSNVTVNTGTNSAVIMLKKDGAVSTYAITITKA